MILLFFRFVVFKREYKINIFMLHQKKLLPFETFGFNLEQHYSDVI